MTTKAAPRRLSRDDILNAQDQQTEDVFVPQWEGTVTIRSMTGTERDQYEASLVSYDRDAQGRPQVKAIELSGDPQGILKYDPQNPIAGPTGDVAYPDIAVGHEMVSLVEAQTNFQANSSALQASTQAYKAILAIKA